MAQSDKTTADQLDPEYSKALEVFGDALTDVPKLPMDDVAGRRAAGDGLFDMLMDQWPDQDNVERKVFHVESADRYRVAVHQFLRKKRRRSSSIAREIVEDVLPRVVSGLTYNQPGSAVLYCHGGGYYSLSVEHYRKVLEMYVALSGVPIFAVDYRLAPEHPFPRPVEDCYAAFKSLVKNAKEYRVSPDRIAVMGDSAGGGLAAALALKARDDSLHPPIKRLILVGPCMDDRTTQVQHEDLKSVATWSDDDNIAGWKAYLHNTSLESQDKPEYASPSRCADLRSLPSLYVEVPELDILRQETVDFAKRYDEQSGRVQVRVWPGVPHSFELFAPNISKARKAIEARVIAMREL